MLDRGERPGPGERPDPGERRETGVLSHTGVRPDPPDPGERPDPPNPGERPDPGRRAGTGMPLPGGVELVEVGLRDGLQAQAAVLSTADKLVLLEGLLDAGLRHIQVASFVHPDKVPQMADAEALCAALPSGRDAVFSALALNLRGVERAAAAGLQKVDVSLSASDAHGRRNAGMGLAQAEAQLADTISAARALGLRVRGGVQCVFGCGPDGAADMETVVRLSQRIAELGAEELCLADSAGMANPSLIDRVVRRVRAAVGDLPLVLHLHDTRGLGLANLLRALQLGVTRFDTAFGGLGGCPFIPGASGNIATEDTAEMLVSMGVITGVDVDAVCAVSARAETLLGVELPSKIYGMSRHARARREPTSLDRPPQEQTAMEPLRQDQGRQGQPPQERAQPSRVERPSADDGTLSDREADRAADRR